MVKITAEYRHANPLKLVFPVDEELSATLQEGTEVLLGDNKTDPVVAVVERMYNNPHERRLIWLRWSDNSGE